jgi:hypothetical protein
LLLDSIDDPSNLKSKPIYFVTGTLDTVVVTGVVEKNQQFFKHYGSNTNLQILTGFSFIHSFILFFSHPEINPKIKNE